MSNNFSTLPANLDKIKEEIQEFIPNWFYKYVVSGKYPLGFVGITPQDETDLYFILKKHLKTHIDFHLFYRWIGIDSEWAVQGFYQGLSPSFFWMSYYKDHKALQIMVKLLRDYQEIYNKHNKVKV